MYPWRIVAESNELKTWAALILACVAIRIRKALSYYLHKVIKAIEGHAESQIPAQPHEDGK
jgi:hypothetical protein